MAADPLAQFVNTHSSLNIDNHYKQWGQKKERPSSYYRPKTYVAKTGINPLVMAAAPLFTLIIALQRTAHYANSELLYQQLVHEIKAFDSTASAQGYSTEFVMVTRYLLCAALDETIEITQWGQQQAWDKRNLLTTFQQESSANERFFLILDQLRESPTHYIDILEIVYLVLSLGFQGRYRGQPHLADEFEHLLDTLYTLIRAQRGEVKKQLSVCRHFQKNTRKKTVRGPALWRTALVGALVLGSLFTAFNYTLLTTSAPLIHSLHSVSQSLPTTADME